MLSNSIHTYRRCCQSDSRAKQVLDTSSVVFLYTDHRQSSHRCLSTVLNLLLLFIATSSYASTSSLRGCCRCPDTPSVRPRSRRRHRRWCQ